MSQFTNFVSIKPLPKEGKRITTKELEFYIDDSLQGEKIVVDCGFVFNGCSIPICLLGGRVNPKTIGGCCIHDYIRKYLKNKYSFTMSNLIFYRALRANGVCIVKRCIYAIGVQLFGWWVYFKIWDKIKNTLRK